MTVARKALSALLVGAGLLGCGPDVEARCMPNQPAERAAWVADCVANANPHSDEEPEDFIRQCAHEADDLFCEWVPAVSLDDRWNWTPCDKAIGEAAEACEAAND